jgi:Ca2+-binding EF-hand superfamily protein
LKYKPKTERELLSNLFNQFDQDHDGYLNAEEMKIFLGHLTRKRGYRGEID